VNTFAALAQLSLHFFVSLPGAPLYATFGTVFLAGSRFAVASMQSGGVPRVLPHASESIHDLLQLPTTRGVGRMGGGTGRHRLTGGCTGHMG
jgi:hypothetical protein